ncbi:MAG: hypothetical protein ACR2J0_02750, partial [Mycobacteriales bacterium]
HERALRGAPLAGAAPVERRPGRSGGVIGPAVAAWNAAAIGFYRSLGAEPMDEWTTYRLSGSAQSDLAGPAVVAHPDGG